MYKDIHAWPSGFTGSGIDDHERRLRAIHYGAIRGAWGSRKLFMRIQ